MNSGKTEEIPQRHQMPRHAPALQFLPVEPCQKINQVVPADRLQSELALLRKVAEFHQVSPIRRHGVRRQSFLDPDVRQKR